MKKIGLSIEEDIYDYLVKVARDNDVTPTTLCRLIIESRIAFYYNNNYRPVFRKQFIEEKQDFNKEAFDSYYLEK